MGLVNMEDSDSEGDDDIQRRPNSPPGLVFETRRISCHYSFSFPSLSQFPPRTAAAITATFDFTGTIGHGPSIFSG
jgi:hypothetical protein